MGTIQYMYTVIYLYIILCTLLCSIQRLLYHISTPNQPNQLFLCGQEPTCLLLLLSLLNFAFVKSWILLSLGKQLPMVPLKMGIFMQCSQCSLMANYLRSTEVLTHPPVLRPQTHTANGGSSPPRYHLPNHSRQEPSGQLSLGRLGLAEHLEKSPVR